MKNQQVNRKKPNLVGMESVLSPVKLGKFT